MTGIVFTTAVHPGAMDPRHSSAVYAFCIALLLSDTVELLLLRLCIWALAVRAAVGAVQRAPCTEWYTISFASLLE